MGCIALLLTCILPSQAAPSASRSYRVQGTVIDGANGQPMVGVTVVEAGSDQNGTTTDVQGSFTLMVEGAESSLVFRYLGYAEQTIKVGTRTILDVKMVMDTESIDDVVVVGYGTQSRVSLTGAVDAISSKDIANRSVPNAVGAIQGKLPGVTVVQKSSQPGNPQISIRVRGEGTLGSNEPLILIDGVPGDINTINPDDIESVSVLKDAATAAIYGVRASGGVVLFTTKKGRQNQPLKVNVSGYYGLQTTTRDPEFLGSVDYMRLRNEARANVGMSKLYSEADIAAVADGTSTLYADTDWVDEIYKSSAPIQNYNISVQGGSERATYYASYGYLDHEGIAISDKYRQKKHNIRATVSADAIKNILKLEGSIAYTLGENTTPIGGTSPIYNALRIAPTAFIRNSEGNYVPSVGNMNPIAEILEGGLSRYKFNDVVLTATATLNIAKGLTAKFISSTYRANGIGKDFARKYEYYDTNNNFMTYNRKDAYLSQSTTQNGSDELTLQGDFNRTFGDHTVTAVIGMTQNKGLWEQYTASKERFATNQLEILNAGEYNPTVGGTANHYALRSWFLRAGYEYKNKYYVEALVRQDMTSRFAKENRVGTFYAFSGSYRLLEEKFMENIKGDILNELKIRGSYGSVGNQNVGGTLYPTYVEMSKYTNIWPLNNQETTGYGQNILPNKNIKWETSYMTNIGLEVQMFRNRLSIVADGWWRKTEDIIRQPVLPSVVGLGSASVNMGVVKSKGWELSIGWNDTVGDWSYSVKADLANTSNRVVSLGGTDPVLNDAMVDVGYEMNALYGYRVERIAQESDFTYDPTTGKRIPKFAYFTGMESSLIGPGDLIYKDLDGSGSIDPEDREVIGSMLPKYTYGINASVAWKNLDFSIFIQGVGKVDGYVYSEAIHPFITDYAHPQKIHLDRWTPEHPDAKYPRLTETRTYNSGYFSDYWLQDASYLRVKNVAIGYTLPERWMRKIGISQCRFYLSAENLFTATDYFYAYDPETILNNGSFYPQLKTYYLGVNLTF